VTVTTAVIDEQQTTTVGRIRVLPAPLAEPPYDDELDRADEGEHRRRDCGDDQGALALAFTLPGGLPTVPVVQGSPMLRLVPAREPGEPSLSEPQQFAGRLVQALVEVVAGARPASQLVRWTSERVYAQINQRVRQLAQAGAPGTRGIIAGQLRSLHITAPLEGVAEVCAVVQRGPRAAAVAVRLEAVEGRWKCTAVQFG
jgi:Family of unknown function (DUF6459)